MGASAGSSATAASSIAAAIAWNAAPTMSSSRKLAQLRVLALAAELADEQGDQPAAVRISTTARGAARGLDIGRHATSLTTPSSLADLSIGQWLHTTEFADVPWTFQSTGTGVSGCIGTPGMPVCLIRR